MENSNNNPLKITKFDNFLLYKDSNGQVKIEICVFGETIWLTQEKIAQLFGVDRTIVTKHLRNIFKSEELQEDSVCAKIAHTAIDRKNHQTKFYNLDTILSVGYRINSIQTTHFRIWANSVLKDHGHISHKTAKILAEKEYEKFHTKQLHDYKSDFDRLMEDFISHNKTA